MTVSEEHEQMAGGVSLIMGAAVGLLLQLGYEREQIRSWVELAFEAHDRSPGDARMAEAVNLLGSFGADVERDMPDGWIDASS